MNDLRYALRQLRKSPGFTFLAVLTLALGIGLNTAIFSLINDLFLRGLPFREQGRLVHLFAKPKDREVGEFPFSAPRFMHYRDGQTIFDGFAAENGSGATLTGLGDPALIQIFRATSNLFDAELARYSHALPFSTPLARSFSGESCRRLSAWRDRR